MTPEWQILEAAVAGAKRLEDEKIAAWLKKNRVTTIYGSMRFDGPYNHGDAAQLIKQVQNKQWKVVWPKEFAPPGVKLLPSSTGTADRHASGPGAALGRPGRRPLAPPGDRPH